MVQLGTFILAFGWFGFNAGSSLAGTDGRIGIVAANTMLAGMSAPLAGVRLHVDRLRQARSHDDVQQHAGGLVAITAPCAFVTRWARSSSARSPACSSSGSVFFFDKLRIDDPVGAISVHGVNGAWGSSRSACSPTAPTARAGTASEPGTASPGLFYGATAKQLVAQLIEVGVGTDLERRRRRRDLLRHRQGARRQPSGPRSRSPASTFPRWAFQAIRSTSIRWRRKTCPRRRSPTPRPAFRNWRPSDVRHAPILQLKATGVVQKDARGLFRDCNSKNSTIRSETSRAGVHHANDRSSHQTTQTRCG